tara:strand:+ start:192 stop:563 length:372 start_codon:yes stop_codon:yes gene_type:complete
MKVIIEGIGKVPAKKNNMRVARNIIYKPKMLKEFEAKLKLEALKAMKSQGQEMTDQPVRISEMIITFGDRRRRDLQNCYGSICDALNNAVYTDDYLIYEHQNIEKRFEKGVWKYRIIIETINS